MRLTAETLRALGAIAYFGEATFSQVRTHSGLLSGTLSPILTRLEAAGWIEHRNETASARAAGKPLRQLYRISDEAAVREAATAVRTVAASILEDIG